MERTNSGWRRMVPAAVAAVTAVDPTDVEKIELFRTARHAGEVLRLSAGQRTLLAQLIGFWGGETYGGRIIVWPSNEILEAYTGITDRSIRYIAKSLIQLRLIESKESANGKRFAIRSKSGQIIDAYGFDLSPLLARAGELAEAYEDLRLERQLRDQAFDQITICRRSTLEILQTMSEWFPAVRIDDLEQRFEHLCAQTPRRRSTRSPDASLAEWQLIRQEAQSRYDAACGGSNDRLIENTNDSPDQSCSKGQGGNDEAATTPSLVELAAACPDAFAFAGSIKTMEDLTREAPRLAGAVLGANKSAWFDAVESLGRAAAAATVFLVLQRYSENSEGIKNPGGYFRAYARLVGAGKASLSQEIAGMRRRRAH